MALKNAINTVKALFLLCFIAPMCVSGATYTVQGSYAENFGQVSFPATFKGTISGDEISSAGAYRFFSFIAPSTGSYKVSLSASKQYGTDCSMGVKISNYSTVVGTVSKGNSTTMNFTAGAAYTVIFTGAISYNVVVYDFTLSIGGSTPTPSSTLSLSPTSKSVGSGGGSGSISVTCSSSWTARSSASWITLTSGSSGSGNGTIGYSVSANASSSDRSGTITVTSGSLVETCTISQLGNSSSQSGATYTVQGSYAENFGQVSFPATFKGTISGDEISSAGAYRFFSFIAPSTGSYKVSLSASKQYGTDCSMGVKISNYSTVVGTVSKGNSTTMNFTAGAAYTVIFTGAISYNVVVYDFTLSIGGSTPTPSSTLSISPTNRGIGYGSVSGSISVTCSSSWTARSSASWITLTYGSSGSGNGTIGYSVSENDGFSDRRGTITVTSGSLVETFTIEQLGNASLETYTIIFDPNGGTGYMYPQTCTASVETQLRRCAFTRDNYTFLGWAVNDPTREYASYGDCDYVNFLNAAGKTYTLYAVWEKKCVTVKFSANGGTGSMSTQSILPDKVAKLNPCAFSPPSGKKFAGWRRSDNGRRYDDGVMVFNLAEPGEMVVMEATWD